MLRNSFSQHDNAIAVNHSHLIMLVRYRQAKILDSCCNWMIFQDMNSQLNEAATAASKPLVNRLFGNAVFGRIRTRYSISSLQEYMANARYSSATAKERTHGNSPL